VFLALNCLIVISVIVMRFMIVRAPDLFPNEKPIIVHVLIFSVVTVAWVVQRFYYKTFIWALDEFTADPTDATVIGYADAGIPYWRVNMVFETLNSVLTIFMLYMLHQFSNFKTTRYDPVTK